jgi:hypothetical protein
VTDPLSDEDLAKLGEAFGYLGIDDSVWLATIDALTAERDRYRDVVDAARELMGDYSQSVLHVRRAPKPGSSPSVCNWCGFSWPCPTAVLAKALAALTEPEDRNG